MEAQRLLGELVRHIIGPHDPQERLDALRRDQLKAKTEIRAALNRLAGKHCVSGSYVDEAMARVVITIGDLTCDAESEYLEKLDIA